MVALRNATIIKSLVQVSLLFVLFNENIPAVFFNGFRINARIINKIYLKVKKKSKIKNETTRDAINLYVLLLTLHVL